MLLRFPVPKRIAGRRIWTQRRFIHSEQPEPHIVDWIRQCCQSGDTFFDIGAHYGWISIAAADCVGPSGRVIAFEPAPALLDVLTFHKRINRLRQVDVVPKAVSAVSGADIPLFLVNGGLSFRNSLTTGDDDVPYLLPQQKTGIQVPSISLDNFCLESGVIPDVIKIDVEGAELLVLYGAERTLAEHSPALIIGVHPFWLPKQQRAEEIFDFLRGHGYEICREHVIDFNGSYLADYFCRPSSAVSAEKSSSICS